jgi:hypothetical protein
MNSLSEAVPNTPEVGVGPDANGVVPKGLKPRFFEAFTTAIAFSAFLLLVCLVQQRAGAPGAAFGGFPDECAHYIGGLAIHDYLAHAVGHDPVAFLRDYHLRVPFFAIGVWPPFFYVLEGLWMGIFGVQRAPVLWMIAASAAGLATLLFWMVRRKLGFWLAASAGCAFLLIPSVQWSACLVMADLTCSLLALASIVFFARFVERGRWYDSAIFGVLAGFSLLTKNSTYFIVLVPPIVVVAGRRWDLLRNRAFWFAPIIAAVLYTPWFVVSQPFLSLSVQGGVLVHKDNLGVQLPAFWGIQRDYAMALWREISIFLPAGIAGAILLMCSKQKMSAFAMCMVATLPAASVGIFVARVMVQGRLLMVPFCALLFLTTELCCFMRPSRRLVTMLAAVLVFGYANWMKFQRPPANDIHSAVAYIQARDAENPGAVLLPSGSEGPWIAEFAANEPHRPQRVMLRPTKMLGTEDWNGTNWQPYYQSLDEIGAFLKRVPVRYCILARRPPHPSAMAQDASIGSRIYPHDALLERAVAGNPSGWRLVYEHPTASGGAYRIFENQEWTPQSEPRVLAEVSRLWRKYLP